MVFIAQIQFETWFDDEAMPHRTQVLHNRSGGATRNLKKTFDALTIPALANFQGKIVKGAWKLEVQDLAVRDEGQLVKFGVELFFA